ncbi:hypothetical protein [Gloeobacter kilaueensis]|uniref:Uncharacterized protein n=1 Tax=Gloeobacter kilaueensis (strain ATCC BAA-2537 / CCAP 1431/1 / ULC 316 / JS1) TaxID=1183438 RepID=U5QJL4_GLOK1|nr:hypothetical protein [Gloeobacter kilaueensis]AGY57835.1 hypothetical protein GKIL_1589 [Gloeobacter kilaueensis JS1]
MFGVWLALSLVLWLVIAVYLLITGNALNQILPLVLLACLFLVVGVVSTLFGRRQK